MAAAQRVYRLTIPLAIISVLILSFSIEYFLESPVYILTSFKKTVTFWSTIIVSFILLSGYLLMFRYHVVRLLKERTVEKPQKKIIFTSVITLASIVLFMLMGLSMGTQTATFVLIYTYTAGYAKWGAMTGNLAHKPYEFIKRARATSLDTAAMIVTAFVVIAAELPMISETIPSIRTAWVWLESVPVLATYRAAYIAMGLGALVMCSRAMVIGAYRPDISHLAPGETYIGFPISMALSIPSEMASIGDNIRNGYFFPFRA